MATPEPIPPARAAFQQVLWNCRYVVVVAVVASLLVGLGMFAVATADAVGLLRVAVAYPFAPAGHDHDDLRRQVVTRVVETVDGYLLATVMLLFAYGLYDLVIAPIHPASEDDGGGRRAGLLVVRTFDDLKDRLAKVVLLILVVKFFEHALEMEFHRPLDLLYLATGVALIAAAIYLSHGKAGRKPPADEAPH